MNLFNGTGVGTLESALNAANLRQKVIANNIANVDTPNFKMSEVKFEEYLQQSMDSTNTRSLEGKRTNARHFYIGTSANEVTPTVINDGETLMNNNNNNVDIDYEMSQMAENQLRYNTYVQQMNHEFRQLHMAIEGRR